jgi:transcriptional regulator with XRE-family HTH domain
MNSAHGETPEHLRESLGRVLRRHREAVRRTLTEIGREAGLSPAYLSEVERGRKDVSSERLVAIAHALGVELATLYTEVATQLRGVEAQLLAPTWPEDPRRRLQAATAGLSQEALRSLAQFGVYLAATQTQPTRRRIGFRARLKEIQ